MNEPARGRGRPQGRKDSYKRDRTVGKLPSKTAIEALMPRVNELVRVSKLAGYHNGLADADGKTLDAREDIVAIDDAVVKLLGDLKELINEST